jgi:hypothetical protein
MKQDKPLRKIDQNKPMPSKLLEPLNLNKNRKPKNLKVKKLKTFTSNVLPSAKNLLI